jgi:hypothetical protein
LAELARLIGQEDPFREMEKEARALRRRETPSLASREPAPEPAVETEKLPIIEFRKPTAAAPAERAPIREAAPAHSPQQYGADQSADDGGYGGAGSDDDYDEILLEDDYEEAPRRRRSGLKTIAAVLVLALGGAGGYYAYRSYVSPSQPGQAPVIKAQTEPAKIVPSTAKSADTPTKIYDRVGDRGQGDKIVPREEQPLDMKEVVGSTGLRATSPAQPSVTGSTTASATAQGQPVAASIEPKKVRTIPIRPDMSAPRPPAAVPTPRVPSATAAPTVTPTPNPTPVQTASIPVNAPIEGYLVQVSSQRTEADAHASYRMLQARFPELLGNRPVIVRRADLGDKGVFYRAQIGPFASGEQAQDMCNSLRAAGGQCLVQKN